MENKVENNIMKMLKNELANFERAHLVPRPSAHIYVYGH